MFSTLGFVKETILWKTIFINVCGNILMFMPFGFLGIVFPKLNDFRTLIINFISAIVVVESLQYITRLGVFDIDDIILNTLGLQWDSSYTNLFWEGLFIRILSMDFHPPCRIFYSVPSKFSVKFARISS